MAHESRGWSGIRGGWWSNGEIGGVSVAFDHGTEARLFDVCSSEKLLLVDVLPFVAKLRVKLYIFDESYGWIRKVFELLEYVSKPSQLEQLTIKFSYDYRVYGGNTVAAVLPTHCVVGLASAIASGAFPSLKELKFKGVQLSKESMSILADALQQREASVMPNLRYLSLRYTTIEKMGILSLAKALSSGRLSSLEELDMTHTDLLESATILVGALQEGEASVLPNLKNLILGNANLRYSARFSLARGIASGRFTSLEKLDLSGNYLSDKSMRILARAFQEGEASGVPNLKHLFLAETRMGKEGMLSLAAALASGRLNVLERLDLSHNNMDEGTRILADVFQKGEATVVPNLKYLGLSSTHTGESGMISLAEALASGRLNSLKELDVLNNTPTELCANAFLSALYGNSHLIVNIKFE